jgi:hypothetical protein
VEQVDRIPGIHPTEDLDVGYRFRQKLGAALAAAAAGIILLPWLELQPDLFDIQCRMDAVVGVK